VAPPIASGAMSDDHLSVASVSGGSRGFTGKTLGYRTLGRKDHEDAAAFGPSPRRMKGEGRWKQYSH
jgi:hypothetical protein